MAEYSYEQVMTALRNADAAGDTEAATRLASIANSYKSQKPVEEPSYGFKEGLTDLAKGTVGTVAGLADLAVGLPKMAASSIAAPIRTAIYGDSNTQRQVSQQAAEDIFGTPSAGLAKLGVPEEYLQGSKSYQTMMKPFELLAEGVEAGGNKISDVTGNRELGGTAKQLADVAMIAAPIPGINLAKRGVAKLLEPFSGAKDAATLKREMGYTSSAAESILKAREEAAAKAQPVPKQPIPEEVTTGAQMDLFRETPEQILARQREQAAGESWGIQRDAQREQGDLFIEAGKEPLQRIIPEDRTPAEIEAAYAQRDAQRQVEFDLASERMRALEEPLTLEPSQRSAGMTGFGRSQRGSIGFFGKDTFEKFADDIRAELPDATTQEIQKAWEDKQKFEQLVAAEQAKATGLGNMGKKVGHELSNYLSVWKDKPQEEVLNVIKQADDNADTSLGFVSNNLLSKGRLGVVRHENAGIRDGISHMINNIDNNRIVGNKLLNDHQTGVNAAARKLETLHGEGDAYAVFEQIFAKQEDPNFQFNLKPDQQKLLTRIKETTDKIWDDMTSTVAKLSPEKAERLSRMKQEWYMPHQFFGDFVSYVRDADGRLLTYIAETSQKEAQRAVEHLRSQLGSEYKIDDAVYVGGKQKALGKKAQDAQRGAAMQEGFAGQFDYMIDLLGSDDPAVQKAQKAVQSVINRRALASEGMRNRMKVNTNVGGSVGNKPWKSQRENYFDAKKSFESYVNSFYEWKGNMENAEFLAKVKDTAPDKVNTYATLKEQMQLMSGLGDQNKFTLVDEAGNRFAKTFGVSPKTINEGARAIGNYETMITTGFYNPVMLYQNFVQSPLTQITTMGQIAAHGGSWNPVRATGYIMSSVLDSLLLGKTNKEWLKYAEEHEISVPGLIESHGKTKIGSASKEYIIAKGTQVSEQTSRLGFFYGMTKYLMETGLKEAEALEVAKNMTRDYMGNYERYARPGLLTRTGAGGELFGRLQVFTTNAFTQFAQITADMAKGIRENNPKLIVPFAAIIATQYLVGGINGTIPMDVAEKLHWASVKAGVIPPEWRSPRQYMLQEHPKVAVSPQSQFIGDWFEGSFRGSVPFTSAPAPQKLVEQLSEIPTAIKWVGDFLTGSNTVSSLDKARLATSVLPASGRGAIEKEFLMGKQGVMVSKNTGAPMYQMPKKEQEDFTSNTNIRSFNRGITTELESLEFSRNQRVNDRRKKIDQQFQEKIADTVNRGEKLDSNFFKESIKRDFELGGDPDLLVRRAFEKAVQANLPNAVVAEIIRDEKNPFKKQRMLQTYKAIQEGTK